jgi:hypothetical protein
LQGLGVFDDSSAMFEITDDTAKNTLKISSTVVPIHNNALKTILYHVLIPILVEKLTLATHTEDHKIETTILVERHFSVKL